MSACEKEHICMIVYDKWWCLCVVNCSHRKWSKSVELPLTINRLLITKHSAVASTTAITAKKTLVGKLFYHHINYSTLGCKQNCMLFMAVQTIHCWLCSHFLMYYGITTRIKGPLHHCLSGSDRANWSSEAKLMQRNKQIFRSREPTFSHQERKKVLRSECIKKAQISAGCSLNVHREHRW